MYNLVGTKDKGRSGRKKEKADGEEQRERNSLDSREARSITVNQEEYFPLAGGVGPTRKKFHVHASH